MTIYTVPDRRDSTDPNGVIDPTGVKDSTAGLQRFLDSTPTGATVVLPFDLIVNGTVTVRGDRTFQSADPVNGRKRLSAPNAYPWRVQPDPRRFIGGSANPAWNPNGICAPWLIDLTGSTTNPYGDPATTGAVYGGYDGTTGASGVDYDGLHLSTRLTAPFVPKHKGMVVRVLAYGGFNEIISSVSADGTTVTWNDTLNVALHESTTHTVAWCVQPKLGWSVVFTPNPAWQPEWIYNPKNSPWTGYDLAIQHATNNNRSRIPLVAQDTATIIGIEVPGSNLGWGQPIISYDASRPVVSEFQHGIGLADQAVAYLCHSHHHYGDGFSGPGAMLACRSEYVGRHCAVGSYDDKLIDHCVLQGAHHAAVDIEDAGGNPVRNVRVTNNTLGTHGISFTSPLIDSVFDGNHSTYEDVNAGTIDALTPFTRGAFHGAQGSRNVTYSNNSFDTKVSNFVVCRLIDGLRVFNNRAKIDPRGGGSGRGYFVRPYYQGPTADVCTNVDVHDNDGGAQSLGQVAP